MNKQISLKGKTFGKLTVIEYLGKNQWQNSIWLCECECGGKKIALYQRLITGDTKSCGCLRGRKKKAETQ